MKRWPKMKKKKKIMLVICLISLPWNRRKKVIHGVCLLVYMIVSHSSMSCCYRLMNLFKKYMFITSIVDECQDNIISYILNNLKKCPTLKLRVWLDLRCFIQFFCLTPLNKVGGGYTNGFRASGRPASFPEHNSKTIEDISTKLATHIKY